MKPPLKDLRSAIAKVIAEERAYHMEEMCKYFGLQEEVSGEPWGTQSKIGYVLHLTRFYDESALIDLAVRVQEYYQLEDLKIVINTFRGGVTGEIKNIIFAANGPKPDLVLSDAMHNTIDIVANAEYCLVYDRPITGKGLSWEELVTWWREKADQTQSQAERDFYLRLKSSLSSEAELFLFSFYFKEFGKVLKKRLPALIPQVYFYFDPKTLKDLQGKQRPPLPIQRMDFLILFSDTNRVVIEIDGKHHYANGDIASPKNYATYGIRRQKTSPARI